MTDYRDSTPMHFPPPAKELRGDGEPMYAEKWPEFVARETVVYFDVESPKMGESLDSYFQRVIAPVVEELKG